MSTGAGFIVYSLEFCPRCELLKEYLTSRSIPFTVTDMSSAVALTELRVNGIFVQEGPVLQSGKKFLTTKELFSGDRIIEDAISGLL